MTRHMSDFIITNATTLSHDRVDIEIIDGVIQRIVPAGNGDPSSFPTDCQYDAAGRLVTPTLAEPHTHVDDAFLAGYPSWNESMTLEEGWRKNSVVRNRLTVSEFKARAVPLLQWFLANGVTTVRTHVNTGPGHPEALEALIELREDFADTLTLQLVAFPGESLHSADKETFDSFTEAIDLGADVVGGIPHIERTREKGVKHVETIAEFAEKHNLPLDPHIDETDDPQSRYTETLLDEAIERDIGNRTTASHVTALHSYSNAYADKLVRLFAESDVSVTTNPLSNAALQGRYDDYPRRRGHTRIDHLHEAGVTVGIGQDDVVNHFNPYGDGDPLKPAFVLAHYAHMNGVSDVRTIWRMLTHANAAIVGREQYGLEAGNDGSVIVFDSTDPFDVLRTQAVRSLVLVKGKQVARTMKKTTIEWEGEQLTVDFDRPSQFTP